MSVFAVLESYYIVRNAEFIKCLTSHEKASTVKNEDVEEFSEVISYIVNYKQKMSPSKAEIIKLDSMLGAATLMKEICVPFMQGKLKIQDIDIERMGMHLKNYLQYPHNGVVFTSLLCEMFTHSEYLKVAKIMLDVHIYGMSEVKKSLIESEDTEGIKANDLMILHKEFLYLFKLYFNTPASNIDSEKSENDLKISSTLQDLYTGLDMKNTIPESIENYEEAVKVAQLLLNKNREILEKDSSKDSLIMTGIPFNFIPGKRLFEVSMLRIMVYTFLLYYAKGGNLLRKLGRKAYSMSLDYHKKLPDNAHVIDQIETLKLMECSLECVVLPKYDADDKPILGGPVLDEMQRTFAKLFKVRLAILNLIKTKKLLNDHFNFYYQVCKSFQSYQGFVKCEEINEGCKIFAELIKTDKKAADLFRNDTGAEFDESKMSIAELVELIQNTESKVAVFRHRFIDIGEILKRSANNK